MSSIITLPLAGNMEEKILLFIPGYFLRSILYQLWCPSDERGSFSPQVLQVCNDRVGSRKFSWWTELNSGPGSAADLGGWPLLPGPLWSPLRQRRLTPDFLCWRYVWDPLERNCKGKQDVVFLGKSREGERRSSAEYCSFLYFSTTRRLAVFSAALRSHWADGQSQTPPLFPNRCWTQGWINWVMDEVSKGIGALTTGLGRRRSTRWTLWGDPALPELGFTLSKQMEKETASSPSMVSLHSFSQMPFSQRRCREEGPFPWLVATQQLYLFLGPDPLKTCRHTRRHTHCTPQTYFAHTTHTLHAIHITTDTQHTLCTCITHITHYTPTHTNTRCTNTQHEHHTHTPCL